MRVSAKVDYGIRAVVELAARADAGGPTKGDQLATAQAIPLRYLENILGELRTSGIVASRRGSEGGYWLAKPAKDISLGDVIRVLEGPLANVQGRRPDAVAFQGPAAPLQEIWVATRAGLRAVLDRTTLADVVSGKLPSEVRRLLAQPGVWDAR